MNIHSIGDFSRNQRSNYQMSGSSNNNNQGNNSEGRSSSFFNPLVFTFKSFSFFILILNIILGLIELIMTYFSDNPLNCTLYLLGAKFTPAIVHDYHFHRFITPIILHGSFIHLLMNSVSIACLSFYVENYIGTKLYPILYIVSGIYGNFFSAVINSDSIGVGASGSIMGLSGFLLLFFLLNFHKISPSEKRFFIYFFIMTILNLFSGIIAKDGNQVDNYAHLGGFITGVFLSIFLIGDKYDYLFFSEMLIKRIKIVFGVLLALIPISFITYLFIAKIPMNMLKSLC